MKISELVKLRENLQNAYNTDGIGASVDRLSEKLSPVGNESEISNYKIQINDLVENLNQLHNHLRINRDQYNMIVENLNRDILRESNKFLTENYSLELRVESEAVANIRKIRVLELQDSIQEEIRTRINLHTNWQYPALEIGCRDGEWTQHLVAADPLYITDQYRDFLESAVSSFTPEYRQRVRSYLIRDTNLSTLPQGQFGFIFCWNFLNYRSFDTIKEYLKSVKELLRPGGVFMFSYNNGDMHECAGYAEGHWMSYIPKSLLVPMCESLGFKVLYTHESRGEGTAISWIELKKHGTLETAKAHQVLGEIRQVGH